MVNDLQRSYRENTKDAIFKLGNGNVFTMITKALIAARSGSQRVKNKNIRPFAGSSLLEIKIEQMCRIKSIDGVIVNSNDEEILNIAKKYDCEIVKRDQQFATNTVSMSEVYKNMAEHTDADVIVYANCTNPLMEDETIEKIVQSYFDRCKEYDSVNSGHLIKEFLFKDNKPLNYSLTNQPRSQDLPEIFALNFAINVIQREKMILSKNVVGMNPYIYCVDRVESTDIDDPIDFEFAEYIYRSMKNVKR